MTAGRACPYVGLSPYTETDRAFFYGRERDREIILSNLYAAPLTVLYGASGVGKSSVLLAGVIPELRATPKVGVVMFREWQGKDFLLALKRAAIAEASRVRGEPVALREDLPLDDLLVEISRAVRGPVFLIFDQFEEYFLYHTSNDEPFEAELARAVNRKDVDANFLLGLREDGLSNLDRLQGRIPNLLGNMLRLEHLDREQAERAIEKPLEQHRQELAPGASPMEIEKALVGAVVEEVESGRLRIPTSRSPARSPSGGRIETAYLQMVLVRLWNAETAAGSRVLRLETLLRLGGSERILSTHLDEVMGRFSVRERDVAARVLRYLVTPAGSKIAYMASDLAEYAELPRAEVERIVVRLSAPDARVLRPIADTAREEEKVIRYEIFHDVLAQAVLDWRARHAVENERRRLQRWVGGLGLLLLVTIFSTLYILKMLQGAEEAKSQAYTALIAADDARARADVSRAIAEQEKARADDARAEAEQQRRRADENAKLLAKLGSKEPEQQAEAVGDLKKIIAQNKLDPEVASAIFSMGDASSGPARREAKEVVRRAAEAGSVALPAMPESRPSKPPGRDP